MSSLEISIQPLRITSGWRVGYINRLYELDPPSTGQGFEELRKYFTEDLLQMIHDERNRVLDVGWYPDGDVESGSYGIGVYEGDCWGPELHTFSTRDRMILVAEIERLLYEVTRGAL